MPIYINQQKKLTHPLAVEWFNIQNNLSTKKFQIMEACNWSERTFSKKIKQAVTNELVLKETEAAAILKILNIDINNYKN